MSAEEGRRFRLNDWTLLSTLREEAFRFWMGALVEYLSECNFEKFENDGKPGWFYISLNVIFANWMIPLKVFFWCKSGAFFDEIKSSSYYIKSYIKVLKSCKSVLKKWSNLIIYWDMNIIKRFLIWWILQRKENLITILCCN